MVQSSGRGGGGAHELPRVHYHWGSLHRWHGPAATVRTRTRRSTIQMKQTMHRIRVVRPRYEQSLPFAGKVGEVIGHWGAENNEAGRLGYLVEFANGEVVGIAEDETEDVPADEAI